MAPEPPGTPAEPVTDIAEAPAVPVAVNASVVFPVPSGITEAGDWIPAPGPCEANAKK